MAKNQEATPPTGAPTDIDRLADALIARQPADPNNLGLPANKIAELTSPLRSTKYRRIACIDEDTKVRFMATVVESKVGPHGRITAISHHRWPDGIYVPVSQGGRVPDGMPIFGDDKTTYTPGMNVPSTVLHKLYKEWRLDEFVKPIFKRYPGREFRAEYCDPEGDGLNTPWAMSDTEIQEPASAHG